VKSFLTLAVAALLFAGCASEPSAQHPMAKSLVSNTVWLADVPSMARASRHIGLLDSLQGFDDLGALNSAMKKWPEGRALLSIHRIGEFNTGWVAAMPSNLWQPSMLRQPYDVRTYEGTSLYEGEGWAAARTDSYVWIATSDLLIEEALRRTANGDPIDSAGRAVLELLPEGGIALGRTGMPLFGVDHALSFTWKGPRTLESAEFEYPDTLAAPLRRGGPVRLPFVDSATVSVAANAIRFTDDERELETLGSGQGVWKTYVRRQPFVMATWQNWADSSQVLDHWTPSDSVADRWTSDYTQYAYTTSFGTTWVSTDDTLRFGRSVAFSLEPAEFNGDAIEAELLRGQGGDLWILREDDGETARWTLTWKPWPAKTASRTDQSAEDPQPQSAQ
jgi:hypothetical protein